MDQLSVYLCWSWIHCDGVVLVSNLPASVELLGCANAKLYVALIHCSTECLLTS